MKELVDVNTRAMSCGGVHEGESTFNIIYRILTAHMFILADIILADTME